LVENEAARNSLIPVALENGPTEVVDFKQRELGIGLFAGELPGFERIFE